MEAWQGGSSLAIPTLLPGHLLALVGWHQLALLLRDLGTLLPRCRAAHCGRHLDAPLGRFGAADLLWHGEALPLRHCPAPLHADRAWLRGAGCSRHLNANLRRCRLALLACHLLALLLWHCLALLLRHRLTHLMWSQLWYLHAFLSRHRVTLLGVDCLANLTWHVFAILYWHIFTLWHIFAILVVL